MNAVEHFGRTGSRNELLDERSTTVMWMTDPE